MPHSTEPFTKAVTSREAADYLVGVAQMARIRPMDRHQLRLIAHAMRNDVTVDLGGEVARFLAGCGITIAPNQV